MVKWKKFLSVLLVICLLVTLSAGEAAAAQPQMYSNETESETERKFLTPNANGQYSYEYKEAEADCMYVLLAVAGFYDSWDDVDISGLGDKILYIDQKTAGSAGVIFDKFIPMKEEDATVFIKGGDKTVHLAGYLKGSIEYTVNFELNGHGETVAPVKAMAGSCIAEPEAPGADGWIFGGWYKDAACTQPWDFGQDQVTGDITLYAKWTKIEEPVPEKDNYSIYPDDQREDIKDCVIADIKQNVYSGKPYLPVPKVTLTVNGAKKVLVSGTDYRLVYSNNVQAGTGTVQVIGIGSYRGSRSAEFVIKPKEIGKLVRIVSCVAAGDTGAEPVFLFDGVKTLTKGVDYDYQITEADLKEKTFQLKVTGMGNYSGSCTVKVPVIEAGNKTIIEAADVALQKEDYEYSGKPFKPEVTVKVNGNDLTKGKDYSIVYRNNKNVGMACVVVSGKGKSYTGKVVKFFSIRPAGSGKFSQIEINKGKALTYTGRQQKPLTVVRANGKKLALNKDYTVEYKNNLIAGEGLADITGIGNYEGFSAEVNFVIGRQDIKKTAAKIKDTANYTLKYNGKILKEGFDYKVTPGSVSNNKADLVFEGLGNFQGTVTKKGVKAAVQ